MIKITMEETTYYPRDDSGRDNSDYWNIKNKERYGDHDVGKTAMIVKPGHEFYRRSFKVDHVDGDTYYLGDNGFLSVKRDDIKLKESSISGRYVWFSYKNIRRSKPTDQMIIDAFNDRYPDYDNPMTSVKDIEFANHNYANHELEFIVTPDNGRKFWAIVGQVPKEEMERY